jgi:hypothetical protein
MDSRSIEILVRLHGAHLPEFWHPIRKPGAPSPPFGPDRIGRVEIALKDCILAQWDDPPAIVHPDDFDPLDPLHVPLYDFDEDIIIMPPRERFCTIDDYYICLFHEIAHSTGHSKRRGRPRGTRCEKHMEEAVAQLSAIYLADWLGLDEDSITNAFHPLFNYLGDLIDDAEYVLSYPDGGRRGCVELDVYNCTGPFQIAREKAEGVVEDLLNIRG